MSQISKRPIKEKVWQKLWQTMMIIFREAKEIDQVQSLFFGLLTETEQIMLAKRLMVSLLVLSDWSCTDIAFHLKMSAATVYKIKAYTDYDKDYQIIIRKVFPRKIKPPAKEKIYSDYWLLTLIEDIFAGRQNRSRLLR